MSEVDHPRVSVVIRSYKRLGALAELLKIVLDQDHESFEVVVIEQTPDPAPADLAGLEPWGSDPRVRLLKFPPLGGPAARNEGVRAARGEIILFNDDDDLPLVDDWIAAHDRAYQEDPDLVALTGRMVRDSSEIDRGSYPEFMRPFIRRRCMSYSWLMTPYTYGRFDEDVRNLGWLHGSNASVRRQFCLDVGLWDTTVRSSDEHSFAMRAHARMTPSQHFGYVAYPPALQRLNIRGGMDKRFVSARAELINNLRYCHRIVGTYHPSRFRLAYPAYLAWTLVKTTNWAMDPGRGDLTGAERVGLVWDMIRDMPGAIREVRAEIAEV